MSKYPFTKWERIEDNISLRDLGYQILLGEEGHDSDNGYFEYVEFWRDREYLYAFAEYDSYFDGYNGAMNSFEYGTLDIIHNSGGWWSKHVKKNKFAPNRDFIKIK